MPRVIWKGYTSNVSESSQMSFTTILMILGRYEHLAIDTEMQAFVSKKYLAGQPANDAQIRAIYAPWGRWQYLAYWFDVIP